MTYLIVATSSFCFCSKGVVAKLMYRQGLDATGVLALRMGIALPFFLLGLWTTRGTAQKLVAGDWLKLAGLGFLGYYLSSVANFAGLQHISVGLERIVLYTYPTLVLLGNWLVTRKRPARPALVGAGLAYLGICLAFVGEAHLARQGAWEKTMLGVGLIFCSAVTYAAFILMSGRMVQKMGSVRFTSITVTTSCLLILLQAAILWRPAPHLLENPQIWTLGALIATVGTVIPAFLLGVGLKRAGATQFAIISSVGPILTLILSYFVLGESLNWAQAVGFIISLAGGLTATLKKSNP
jgi:drug/metabolite transporter (DMT)-like permease